MTGTRRLRAGAYAAAGAWFLAALALARPPAPEGEPPSEPTARVTPVPEEPRPVAAAEPEPAPPPPEPRAEAPPEPPAPKPAPPEPAPLRVDRADAARGSALLDGSGAFPALSLGYEAFASFRDYAHAMTRLGARFVVVRDRAIVGGVDVAAGTLGAAAVDARYSPRARDYTGEPALSGLAAAARRRFGESAVVMMLVPRPVDAGLFGGVARALDARGERPGTFREIRGRYEPAAGGGVRLRLTRALRSRGGSLPLDLVFDLGQVASASGDAA